MDCVFQSKNLLTLKNKSWHLGNCRDLITELQYELSLLVWFLMILTYLLITTIHIFITISLFLNLFSFS